MRYSLDEKILKGIMDFIAKQPLYLSIDLWQAIQSDVKPLENLQTEKGDTENA